MIFYLTYHSLRLFRTSGYIERKWYDAPMHRPYPARRIAVFTDKYPLLGPLVWVLSVQYFLVQLIVAAAWHPPYSWAHNLISDLGNTACGM